MVKGLLISVMMEMFDWVKDVANTYISPNIVDEDTHNKKDIRITQQLFNM